MGNESGAWVDEEFEALDLGDPRRDRRAKELLKRSANNNRRLKKRVSAVDSTPHSVLVITHFIRESW